MNKQHILSEIRRTAAANGGVPLVRERYLRETGIKTHDWIGKFWARWGDAIREAGFAPNELQTAYSKDLLRFFADRAAKKWPLRGGLKLR